MSSGWINQLFSMLTLYSENVDKLLVVICDRHPSHTGTFLCGNDIEREIAIPHLLVRCSISKYRVTKSPATSRTSSVPCLLMPYFIAHTKRQTHCVAARFTRISVAFDDWCSIPNRQHTWERFPFISRHGSNLVPPIREYEQVSRRTQAIRSVVVTYEQLFSSPQMYTVRYESYRFYAIPIRRRVASFYHRGNSSTVLRSLS